MSAVIANTAPRGSAALYRRRRITNVVAITLACAAALFGLAFLGWILWTLLAKGLAHLGPSLFTQDQPPPMEAGGLRNAIVGSLLMCGNRRSARHRRRHLAGRSRQPPQARHGGALRQ